MSRVIYFSVASLLIALNGAGLLSLLAGDATSRSVIMTALIINLVLWPLALVVAYRIGQATATLKHAKAATHGGHKR